MIGWCRFGPAQCVDASVSGSGSSRLLCILWNRLQRKQFDMSPHIFYLPYPTHKFPRSDRQIDLLPFLPLLADPIHFTRFLAPSLLFNSGIDDSCAPVPFRLTAAFHSLTPLFISAPLLRSMAHPSAVCRPFPTELHNGRAGCPGYHNLQPPLAVPFRQRQPGLISADLICTPFATRFVPSF